MPNPVQWSSRIWSHRTIAMFGLSVNDYLCRQIIEFERSYSSGMSPDKVNVEQSIIFLSKSNTDWVIFEFERIVMIIYSFLLPWTFIFLFLSYGWQDDHDWSDVLFFVFFSSSVFLSLSFLLLLCFIPRTDRGPYLVISCAKEDEFVAGKEICFSRHHSRWSADVHRWTWSEMKVRATVKKEATDKRGLIKSVDQWCIVHWFFFFGCRQNFTSIDLWERTKLPPLSIDWLPDGVSNTCVTLLLLLLWQMVSVLSCEQHVFYHFLSQLDETFHSLSRTNRRGSAQSARYVF